VAQSPENSDTLIADIKNFFAMYDHIQLNCGFLMLLTTFKLVLQNDGKTHMQHLIGSRHLSSPE
jgi:hypothetical protein